jgi:PAS domain-containing protein
MSGSDAFGRDLADFVRRVGELRAARALPSEERRGALDAALFELQHAAETLWPRYERLAAGAPAGRSAERQESRLLKAVFQRLPLPVALVDGDTAVRRMNQAATALTGVRPGTPRAGRWRRCSRRATGRRSARRWRRWRAVRAGGACPCGCGRVRRSPYG